MELRFDRPRKKVPPTGGKATSLSLSLSFANFEQVTIGIEICNEAAPTQREHRESSERSCKMVFLRSIRQTNPSNDPEGTREKRPLSVVHTRTHTYNIIYIYTVYIICIFIQLVLPSLSKTTWKTTRYRCMYITRTIRRDTGGDWLRFFQTRLTNKIFHSFSRFPEFSFLSVSRSFTHSLSPSHLIFVSPLNPALRFRPRFSVCRANRSTRFFGSRAGSVESPLPERDYLIPFLNLSREKNPRLQKRKQPARCERSQTANLNTRLEYLIVPLSNAGVFFFF